MPLPGTWRVMEQPTMWGPSRTLANQNPSFSTEGKELSSSHEPNLNQPVITGMSLNLLPINSAPAQVAGCLKFFQNWHLITDDPWVLEAIMGYQIAWPHTFMSTPQQDAVQAAIDKTALQGAIHPVSSNTEEGFHQQYISSQQEGRWPPPTYKPKKSEFLCELPTFQNGGNSRYRTF